MAHSNTAAVHAALASPVRRRVLDVLATRTEPLGAQQLARELELHVTTLRFHLDQLEQAGLVVRQTERAARPRPAVLYRVAEAGVTDARVEMIEALAEAMADGPPGTPGAIAAGRRWADRVVTTGAGTRAELTEAFNRLGFEPESGPDGPIRLHACPFREAARRNRDVVCGVHLGLASGLAARTGEQRVGLVPFSGPNLCLVTLEGA